MRKGLIYLIMTMFLLFLAENRQSLDFQQDYGTPGFSLHLFSAVKKHQQHSASKTSFHQDNDALNSPEENNQNDFDGGSLTTMVVIAAIGLGFLLHHFFLRTKQIFYNSGKLFFPAKRFILLRNIRI